MSIQKITRVCLQCKKVFHPHSGGLGRFCSRKCAVLSHTNTPEQIDAKFLAKVGPPTASGCLMWTGATSRGYGYFGSRRVPVRAHRYAYERAFGPIPDGLCVCHRCDTPGCVNVDHLFLGTNADNTRDMISKGRHPKGEDQGAAKITLANVQEIRARRQSGEKLKKIGKDFGISESHVCNIAKGRWWQDSFHSQPLRR